MTLPKPFARRVEHRRTQKRVRQYRELIRREAAIGGQLFGPLPEGARREFLCLNERMWLWHEELPTPEGTRQVSTTCYEVRRGGIYKMQETEGWQPVNTTEAARLRAAAELYFRQVNAILYNSK